MTNPITPDIFKQIEPLIYVSKFLDDGVRPDGRTGLARSMIEIKKDVVESCLGSASVRIGNTSVIAAVNGGIFLSPPGIVHSSGTSGKLNVSCDYSLCLLGDRRQAQIMASKISQPIESVLNNTNVFDTQTQLVVDTIGMEDDDRNEKPLPVWDITVNILVVRADGSVLDCALMSAVAAIKNARLPYINLETMLVDGAETRQLKISSTPLAFSLVSYKDKWLPDPINDEEDVLPRMCIIVDGDQPDIIFGVYGPDPPIILGAGSTVPNLVITDLSAKILPLIREISAYRISKLH